MPRLTAQQLRDAGLATSVSKSVPYDGIHPRHMAMLSDQGLGVLAMIWEAFELTTVLSPQVQVTMAPLIPKKGSGFRDIAVFPGIIRACANARLPFRKQRGEARERQYFAAGAARSARTSSGAPRSRLRWPLLLATRRRRSCGT